MDTPDSAAARSQKEMNLKASKAQEKSRDRWRAARCHVGEMGVEKECERGVQSRIIVLSAHVTAGHRGTYEELGVQAVFEKLFDVSQLRAAVGDLASEK
jgi:hypothetical protein